MIFWIFCSLLTAIGIYFVLRPLLASQADPTGEVAADLSIYRDQLDEITRDQERGLLSEEEAEAARLEISRRILQLDEKRRAATKSDAKAIAKHQHGRLAAATAVAIVAIAGGGYAWVGSPGMDDRPRAERLRADPAHQQEEELVARVEERLKASPNDARGWDVIAPVYLKRRDYKKAVVAYERAIALNGENDRRLTQYAEALLGAAGGQVTAGAKEIFERLLKTRPDYIPARFWIGVWHEQNGDNKSAKKFYEDLLKHPNMIEPMRGIVSKRLTAVGGKPSEIVAQRPQPANEGGGSAPAISREAQQEMAQLSPEQRNQRIHQMVEGLANRLRTDGGDLRDWQRLIRSYTVLGDRQKALVALADAKKSLSGSASDVAALDQFAGSLGLGQSGSSEAAKGPAPSPEARQEMAQLSPEQRNQRIHQMVEGLASRLRENGGSVEEWLRLIRSYAVLRDREKAVTAIADARKALAKSESDVKAIDAFAAQIGLGPGGASEAAKGPAPSPEARQEMARLSPEQRNQRIRQMVEGLANRLRSDGGNVQEWQRLIRSYVVLGDKDNALAALADAKKALASSEADVKAIEASAVRLGLAGQN